MYLLVEWHKAFFFLFSLYLAWKWTRAFFRERSGMIFVNGTYVSYTYIVIYIYKSVISYSRTNWIHSTSAAYLWGYVIHPCNLNSHPHFPDQKTYHRQDLPASYVSYPPWFTCTLYPPVSGSCCILNISVDNPNGFKSPLPNYCSPLH